MTEYVAYLEAANRGDPASASRHRQAYNRAIPRADIALNVAGRVPWMAPPPLAGGGEFQPGLSACVRIIEQWHSDPTPLLDTIEQAHATLAEYERHPPRTRRSLRLPRLHARAGRRPKGCEHPRRPGGDRRRRSRRVVLGVLADGHDARQVRLRGRAISRARIWSGRDSFVFTWTITRGAGPRVDDYIPGT